MGQGMEIRDPLVMQTIGSAQLPAMVAGPFRPFLYLSVDALPCSPMAHATGAVVLD